MLGKVPIPKGPILAWIKSEYQGEGHETKERVIRETADLANKILASYTFYIEEPGSPGPEHREQFRDDIDAYGKRAVELRKFALQSDAPAPPEADVEMMRRAQRALAEQSGDGIEIEALLHEPVANLDVSQQLHSLNPKDTLDDFFNKIDNDLYLMYYSILEQIVEKCTAYAVTEEVDPAAFDELSVSLRIALKHFDGGSN